MFGLRLDFGLHFPDLDLPNAVKPRVDLATCRVSPHEGIIGNSLAYFFNCKWNKSVRNKLAFGLHELVVEPSSETILQCDAGKEIIKVVSLYIHLYGKIPIISPGLTVYLLYICSKGFFLDFFFFGGGGGEVFLEGLVIRRNFVF